MAKRVSEEKEKLDAKGEADLSKKDPTLPVYVCPFLLPSVFLYFFLWG